MSVSTTALPNSKDAIQQRVTAGQVTWAWPLVMLVSRTVLFALFQATIGVICALQGLSAPWNASVAWWPVTVTLTNLACVALLAWLARREGMRWWDLYRVERHRVGRELLILLGLLVVIAPAVQVPNVTVATWLFGDPQRAFDLFFRPLPLWVVYVCLVLFPLTHVFAELATYYGYTMPRLAALSGRRWVAISLAAFWHAAQHCMLPLLFDWRFILWRLLMFLPLAFLMAFILNWRPRLLPYMMVIHGLLDFPLVLMLLSS